MDPLKKQRRASQIRGMIHADCPAITQNNWTKLHEDGWRWECNLDTADDDAVKTVREYLTRCGEKNVTVGHRFDEGDILPESSSGWLGIYIRDVQDVVDEFRSSLENERALEEWLA